MDSLIGQIGTSTLGKLLKLFEASPSLNLSLFDNEMNGERLKELLQSL